MAEEAPPRPVVKNVVAVFTLQGSEPYNLATLAPQLQNTEYKPSRMNTLVLRVPGAGATAQIFSSGRCVLTGSKTMGMARTAADIVAGKLRALDGLALITVVDFAVRNIVSVWSFGFQIRLEGVAEECWERASYEPELFPACRLRLSVGADAGMKAKVTANIFANGKCTFLGAKSLGAMEDASRQVQVILLRHRRC